MHVKPSIGLRISSLVSRAIGRPLLARFPRAAGVEKMPSFCSTTMIVRSFPLFIFIQLYPLDQEWCLQSSFAYSYTARYSANVSRSLSISSVRLAMIRPLSIA